MQSIRIDSGEHDRGVSIDVDAMEATLALVPEVLPWQGHSLRQHGLVHARCGDPGRVHLRAGLERGPRVWARTAIVPFVNGPTRPRNPEGQGLLSALRSEGAPLERDRGAPKQQGQRSPLQPAAGCPPRRMERPCLASACGSITMTLRGLPWPG